MPNDDEEPEGESNLPLNADGSVNFEEIERQYKLKFPPRTLAPEEQAIIDELWRRKLLQTDFEAHERGEEILPTVAYCTAAPGSQLTMSHWNGNHPPDENTIEMPIPPGTTLKILVISRLGDFGLTDDLKAEHGYGLRVPWDDARIINLRWEP